ncbi:MAG: sigma-70 family RNA polymerase sigma factor [Negativicoccus succinicivorans]|uniref:sigma-70 family RNA polymerase sigma factor n=1 Tax=Negativicoccus succinicivorans TaxID=620903 RepID=UPI0026EF5775|nr:sigma-70 family RNA polymerase sigma factor [Negativicoccus succinicivorans]MBS6028848.1 sigma-70 family RNA polymerase sigma factor [Negativicoccus succinicivorans]
MALEGEGFTQAQREKMIQGEWNEQFNRPEYNNWHKFDRHRGYSKAQPGKDGIEDEINSSKPLMDEVADERIFRKYEIEHEKKEDYEAVCRWVRKILVKKPEWADAFIAVYLNDESIRNYAARIGADENNITQKLKRAKKNLEKIIKTVRFNRRPRLPLRRQ